MHSRTVEYIVDYVRLYSLSALLYHYLRYREGIVLLKGTVGIVHISVVYYICTVYLIACNAFCASYTVH